MIEIQNVSKTFKTKKGEVKALQNVSVNIDEGEIFGIIGHSGAGKSTLIRCINLLEKPTRGNVRVDGEDLTNLSTKQLRVSRQKIGMIFQHFNLMPSRTVLQNVLFPLRKQPGLKEEKLLKATKLLSLVGLSDKHNAYPSQLSGGQKQRVAIARALVNDPKILLCDEATSALDPETTASILKLLKEVSLKLDITIVLITHAMDVIKEICDRVAVMEAGAIKEIDEVAGLFANPKSEIAKQFVNQISGMGKIYDLVEQGAEIVDLATDEKLIKLTYTSGSAKNPIIFELGNKFDVTTNILFGNIELIKGQPIGNLIITASGKPKNLKAALDYVIEKGINVEVMK